MVNQIISATRYNELQGRIAGILGAGSGDKGYNATVSSSAVPVLETVLVIHMNNLYADFTNVYAHIYGILPSTISTVTTDNEITEVLYAAYETLITTLETNRFTLHPDQDSLEASGINTTRTTVWGGTSLPQTINHSFTVNFGTANARRGFFNAGGEIQFTANLTHELGPSDANYQKNVDWDTMLSNMQTIKFKRTITDNTNPGSGTGSSTGSEDLNTGYQTLFLKTGSATYTNNSYSIQAKLVNDFTIEFNIQFADADVGAGGADEYVTGTLSSTIAHLRASGSYVNNPAPSYVNTSTL